LKRELWPRVKVGTWLIYADEYEGVFRAKVVEVDVRIYEPGLPSRWGYPYGFTKDTGTVKIQLDSRELIENLTNLVQYSASRLNELRKAWESWQSVKAEAEGYREQFLALAKELRGL